MNQTTAKTQANPDSQAAAPAAGRMSLGRLLVWVGMFAFLTLLGVGLVLSRRGSMQEGTPLPAFTLHTFDGQEINTADLGGKVVVINFWASWCPPCKEEAPYLESAWRYYEPRGDVIFLGLTYADTEPESREYIKNFDITYPNGPDLGTDVFHRFRATGVPETYIFGPDGKLAYKIILPFQSEAQIRSAIDPLLNP